MIENKAIKKQYRKQPIDYFNYSFIFNYGYVGLTESESEDTDLLKNNKKDLEKQKYLKKEFLSIN